MALRPADMTGIGRFSMMKGSRHGGCVMEWLSRSDVILMAIGAYVAVMALVRLMRLRRDVLVADVQRQVEAHRHHRKKRHHHPNQENRGAA
jgi:ABC-type nickel/cobalt efflux system permease component RcnA